MVVNPIGEVVLETLDQIAIAHLDLSAVEDAKRDYPGYLEWHAQTYIQGWQDVLQQQKSSDST